MLPWSQVGVVLAGAALVMALVWELQRRTRNAGYVDVAWSYLMGAAGLFYAVCGTGNALTRGVLAAMALAWGIRLGTHLLIRVGHEPEDGRYKFLREHWNDHQGKFFGFFMFQAGLTATLSLPYLVVANNAAPGELPRVIAAIAVFVVSVGLESVADRQLAAFRGDPANKGKVCDVGLWRWSRHPNYFFEWLHWSSYIVLALGAATWWLAPLGSVLMLCTLLWATGIPFVEAQSLRSRGEAYRAYQGRTSVFVPWPPKSGVRD